MIMTTANHSQSLWNSVYLNLPIAYLCIFDDRSKHALHVIAGTLELCSCNDRHEIDGVPSPRP